MQKPTNADIAVIFDGVAARYDAVSNPYTVGRRLEFMTTHAKGECLEVGAGSGVIARAFMDCDHKVTASDISPKMVEVMRGKGINAVVADAEALPFLDGSFDTVIAAEMLYYLDHPERFLKEARRVLRPNGILLLSSASKTAEIYDRFRALLRVLGVAHMYFNDPVRTFMGARQLRALLTENGFTAQELWCVMPLPFTFAEKLNRFLERTPLRYLGIFLYAKGEKISSRA